MGACRLLLLGPPLFQREDRIVPIRLRKGLALAAYLAVERRAFSREYLATLLWPELGQQSAHANLRRMLTYLRETLGESCIETDGDLVRFSTAFGDVDLVEFQSFLHVAPSESTLEQLEAAAALYRGGFLEGFVLGDCLAFDEWQDGVRRQTEEQFDELLETLCRAHLCTGQVKSAVPFAQRWLELDPLNEAAHRMLMEIHARAGRPDLARKQFESCSRTLSREGLEPDEQTRELYKAIRGHRLDASLASPARASDRSARRRRRRWVALGTVGIFVIAAIMAACLLRRFILGCDLSVVAVKPILREEELSRIEITLKNGGIALPRVRYAVAFSSDQTVVAPRDYVVFTDEVRMRWDSELAVAVERWSDLQQYIDAHNVKIPPGTYSLTVIVDPEGRIGEDAELNNQLRNNIEFFYPGSAPEAAFTVDVTYRGGGVLDGANPLKLFIGDKSHTIMEEWCWSRFVVAREGRYYLPVEDLPLRDSDGSGYVLIVIYDTRNDSEYVTDFGPGDIGAIYKEGTTSLSYGVFNVASGTAIWPGQAYRIDFIPPKPPSADAYEVDDKKEISTVVDYPALPVRQRHTFHDEGTGDRDEDWFRIALRAGDTIAVETYSAGGAWECDTAIDIADSQDYMASFNDKSEYDLYSVLTYTNDTGKDQIYYFQVKPYRKYAPGINRFADYIIEFRR